LKMLDQSVVFHVSNQIRSTLPYYASSYDVKDLKMSCAVPENESLQSYESTIINHMSVKSSELSLTNSLQSSIESKMFQDRFAYSNDHNYCKNRYTTAINSYHNLTVGQGEKVIQIFYTNPFDGTKHVFPAVRVCTDKEVELVMALVSEESALFKRKLFKDRQTTLLSAAREAECLLDRNIVKHIKKCFTKRGMSEFKFKAGRSGLRRKNFCSKQLRKKCRTSYSCKRIIDQVSGQKVKEEAVDDVEDQVLLQYKCNWNEVRQLQTENVKPKLECRFIPESKEILVDLLSVDSFNAENYRTEYVPSEKRIRLELEGKIFGGILPKSVRRFKPPRKGISNRTGRGGRNETVRSITQMPQLGDFAVSFMLQSNVHRCKSKIKFEPYLVGYLSKLLKIQRRRKRSNVSYKEDADFKGSFIKIPQLPDEASRRKSKRLEAMQVCRDTEEHDGINKKKLLDNGEGHTALPFSSRSNLGNLDGSVEWTSNQSEMEDGPRRDFLVNENYFRAFRTCWSFPRYHFDTIRKMVLKIKEKSTSVKSSGYNYNGFGLNDCKEQVLSLLDNVKNQRSLEFPKSDEESLLINELLAFAEGNVWENFCNTIPSLSTEIYCDDDVLLNLLDQL